MGSKESTKPSTQPEIFPGLTLLIGEEAKASAARFEKALRLYAALKG